MKHPEEKKCNNLEDNKYRGVSEYNTLCYRVSGPQFMTITEPAVMVISHCGC